MEYSSCDGTSIESLVSGSASAGWTSVSCPIVWMGVLAITMRGLIAWIGLICCSLIVGYFTGISAFSLGLTATLRRGNSCLACWGETNLGDIMGGCCLDGLFTMNRRTCCWFYYGVMVRNGKLFTCFLSLLMCLTVWVGWILGGLWYWNLTPVWAVDVVVPWEAYTFLMGVVVIISASHVSLDYLVLDCVEISHSQALSISPLMIRLGSW